ncbi:MAG: phospholipid transport system substrate-binding protein [Rickettsiales bacterium]|jgi:phospholipid transport system substrate-binding protein
MSKAFFSLILFFCALNPSFAENPEKESKEVEIFISNLGNKIIEVASDEELTINQRRDKLVNLVDEAVDTNWISKFVLGKNYRVASDDQKMEFKLLYRDFMINSYGPQFTGYRGEKFLITSVTHDNNYYVAECLFLPEGDAPAIKIDFRVRKNKSTQNDQPKFLVFDIVAEGVSLIATQRSEFGSAISRDGMDKFLKDLKERIIQIKKDNNNPAAKAESK